MTEIFLTKHRASRFQRAHFALFIPVSAPPLDPRPIGTKIHVVGMPMAGFTHEIKHDFQTGVDDDLEKMVLIGTIKGGDRKDVVARVEAIASSIPAPRKCENFMVLVNDEWTMDVVKALVGKGLFDEDAVAIVHQERDEPGHGIGLRSTQR